MILKASAEKGAVSDASRVSTSCVSGFSPRIGGTSSGEGR